MNDDIIYNGLTSSAYTDYKFWLEEGKTIFSDSWVFVGYKHELNRYRRCFANKSC